jgi:hypothetical protein
MPAIVSRLRIPAAPLRNRLHNLPCNLLREPHSGPAGHPAIRLPALWKSWLPAFQARRERNVVESALLCVAVRCMVATFSARGTMQLGLPYRPTPRRPIVCSLVNTTFAVPSPPIGAIVRHAPIRIPRSPSQFAVLLDATEDDSPSTLSSPAPMPARRSRVSTQSSHWRASAPPHLSLILGYRSLGK